MEGMIMKYDPQKHHRRSIRLKGYDYTQPGAYFVTICAYQRMHVFGEVVDGEIVLNDIGKIARDEWFKTAEIRPYVKLYEDEFVIMPNHGHGIIWIVDEAEDGRPVGLRRLYQAFLHQYPVRVPGWRPGYLDHPAQWRGDDTGCNSG